MTDKDRLNRAGQGEIEEIRDTELDQINGGLAISTLSCNEKHIGLKPAQALVKPSSFTKSDDRLPSNNGF